VRPFWLGVENPVRLVQNDPSVEFCQEGWVEWAKGKLFCDHVLDYGNKILLCSAVFGAKI
jgi:hypothetical protein